MWVQVSGFASAAVGPQRTTQAPFTANWLFFPDTVCAPFDPLTRCHLPIPRYTQVVVTHSRLRTGELFASEFEVGEVLGTGSMGIAYRARLVSTGEPVALKLMHPDLAMDPKSVHRFDREARAGMSIQCRHVARVLKAGCDVATGRRWIAMELAEGRSLAEFVEQHQPLEGDRATDILHQLFVALSAAHSAGVVHRDLKPDNILVTDESPPLLKVLDFGIAKSLASETAVNTSPGQGAPLWTAPEQCVADQAPHPSADVWSLGLLTFYVLTGKIYWRNAQGSSNMVQLSIELLREPIARASERAAEMGVSDRLPDGFDDWFSLCVDREKKQRFSHASEALRSLMIVMNRRGRPRHRLWLPVYTDALAGGVAVTHDASDNGMLLLTRDRLSVDDQIEVRFCVPPGEGREFRMSATVVRVGNNDENPDGVWRYQTAIAFERRFPELSLLFQRLEHSLGLPHALNDC